ncbi:MAG TPA: hypothetical protein VGS22_21285 [Thermoanaerobaculia bacterium]|nr:hypothetical protein [Thermoanaerobaculia bacterium]
MPTLAHRSALLLASLCGLLAHSGCLICLYSCPGSKIGNRAYTVRDYTNKTTAFRVREGVLPKDGTEVTIVLRAVPPRR